MAEGGKEGNGEKKPVSLIHIYQDGAERKVQVNIPIDEVPGKLFAVDILIDAMKTIMNAPIKQKEQSRIITRAGDFLNRLRNFLPKK